MDNEVKELEDKIHTEANKEVILNGDFQLAPWTLESIVYNKQANKPNTSTFSTNFIHKINLLQHKMEMNKRYSKSDLKFDAVEKLS